MRRTRARDDEDDNNNTTIEKSYDVGSFDDGRLIAGVETKSNDETL